MSNYGLKIAKPGYDVEHASNQHLQFSTAMALFKTIGQGYSSLVIPAGSFSSLKVDSFKHGLTYAPCVMVYWTDTFGDNWRQVGEQNYMLADENTDHFTKVYAAVTDTEVIVYASKISRTPPDYLIPATTIYYKFIIYAEPA